MPPACPSRTSALARDLQPFGDPRSRTEPLPRVRREKARRRRAEEAQQRLKLAAGRAWRKKLVGRIREDDEPGSLVGAHELAHGRLEAALEHARGEVENDDAARARRDERCMADVVLTRDEHGQRAKSTTSAPASPLARSSSAYGSDQAGSARSQGSRVRDQAGGA